MPPATINSAAPLVALRGVGKAFPNGVRALVGLDLEIRRGEFVALLGPSGCGKSTALRIIAGLSEPTDGALEWPSAAIPQSESRIGFVFQEPTLMPWATVFNNVLLPLELRGESARYGKERVEASLERVGLSAFRDAYPRELSGGMRMRVSIARALVTEPQLLLMDEPFAALDEITRFKLNDDLLRMWQALRTTVVFVTHSVFEFGLFVEPHRGDGGAPGARRSPSLRSMRPIRATRDFRTSPRTTPHVDWRAVPREALATGHGGGSAHRERGAHVSAEPSSVNAATARCASRLPIVVLALGLSIWEVGRADRRHSALCAARSGPHFTDARHRLGAAVAIAPGHARSRPSRAFCSRPPAAWASPCCSISGGLLEYSLYPYAVILQVTPIVAVAPLLLIYLPQQAAVLVCAWIVAFFPVLANTTLGLHSVDRNLADLFSLYGASRGQVLWRLKLPSALPYILGGLRIAGGLSLIGAVVAEIAAGSAGAGSGLAYRIAESGYRLNIPRMFAALLLLSLAGIVIFYLLSLINYLALRRWHESALGVDR